MRRSCFSIAVTALLIIGQCLAVLHAAEFGTGPHQHDGVECFVALPEDDYDVALSSFSECIQVISESLAYSAPISRTYVPSSLYSWPPSTAPPLNA